MCSEIRTSLGSTDFRAENIQVSLMIESLSELQCILGLQVASFVVR